MRKQFTAPAIASSEITPESIYLNRRKFMQAGAGTALAFTAMRAASSTTTGGQFLDYRTANPSGGAFYTDEDQTPVNDASSYCNFYEFGTSKTDPASYAHEMSIDPLGLEGGG